MPHIGLARVVAQLVSRPVGVGDHDQVVGPEERQIVVAAVPEHDVGLLLAALQDRAVVHPGVNHVPACQVRLVFLASPRSCNRCRSRSANSREALDALRHEVAIGHRVTHHDDPPPRRAQDAAHPPRGLALSRSPCAPRRRRSPARRPRAWWRSGRAAGSRRPQPRARRQVHDLLVGDVAVGEGHEPRHAPARGSAVRGRSRGGSGCPSGTPRPPARRDSGVPRCSGSGSP